MPPKNYIDNFFTYHLNNSLSSAKAVIPIVLKYLKPENVIDIGCGVGTWLSVWQEYGVKNVKGVDGDYVLSDELLIDRKDFVPADLEKGFKLNQKFDLVTSLEVAEHLKPENAENFISALCELGDIILFSAAIPGQEGTLHYNEQYPDYWIALFAKKDFVPYDCIREQIWYNEKVSVWYRQNLLFFVKTEASYKYSSITNESRQVLSIVHPGVFNLKTLKVKYYEDVLKSPFSLLLYFLKKYLRGLKNIFKK